MGWLPKQLSQGRPLRETSQISTAYWSIFISSACCSEILQPFSLIDGWNVPLLPIYGGSKEKAEGLRLSVVIWLAADLKKTIISYRLFFYLKRKISEAHTFFLPFPIRTGTCCTWVLLGSCFFERGNLQLNQEKDCTCQISGTTFETF